MHLPLRFLTFYYRFKKHMDYNSQTKGRFVVRMREKWAAQTHAKPTRSVKWRRKEVCSKIQSGVTC